MIPIDWEAIAVRTMTFSKVVPSDCRRYDSWFWATVNPGQYYVKYTTKVIPFSEALTNIYIPTDEHIDEEFRCNDGPA